MGKPNRSPLLGYNHNVKYRGRIFHVQTEDSGPANPHIFSHLFFAGTILASKRHVYDPDVAEAVVRGLMQGQHKGLLKELKSNLHDKRIGQFFTARGEALDPLVEAPAEAHQALDLDALAPPAPEDVDPGMEAHAEISEEVVPIGEELSKEMTVESRPAPPRFDPPIAPTAPGGPGMYRGDRPNGPERPFQRTPIPVPIAPPSRAVTPPVVVIPPPRRLPVRAPSNQPITPVVVQRTVTVGGTQPQGGPVRPVPVPRTRRPAQAIPYVVREGSHPLAHRSVDSPPARPLAPTPGAAARTGIRPPESNTGAVDMVADKSLDEVILAYLNHGSDEPR